MITLTYQFKDHEALHAHLDKLAGLGLNASGTMLESAKTAEKSAAPLAQTTGAVVEAAPGAASPSPNAGGNTGAADPAAAQSAEITLDDVRAEFRAYVQRPGLTAQTAHANIFVPHGLNALKDAKPEQFRALYNAFRSAV